MQTMKKETACRFVLAAFVICQTLGCTSISSTMLNRTETDDFIANSNGEPKKHCAARPFKGVPITLRVPTHVDVAIYEKIRLCLKDDDLSVLRSQHRHLSVATQLIYTDKVFTVDVKRPAAGIANYTFTFGDETGDLDNKQYFKSIQSRIEDETIEDVTGAIETVLSGLRAANDAEGSMLLDSNDAAYFDRVRTVAWKRFDCDAVDFEYQLAEFVSTHMNCNSYLEYGSNAFGGDFSRPGEALVSKPRRSGSTFVGTGEIERGVVEPALPVPVMAWPNGNVLQPGRSLGRPISIDGNGDISGDTSTP
jgi:hypothetical protein